MDYECGWAAVSASRIAVVGVVKVKTELEVSVFERCNDQTLDVNVE
jgi:hypothetical protein